MQNRSAFWPSLAHYPRRQERFTGKPALKSCIVFLVGLAFLTVPVAELHAQSLFATLTGVVSDQSGGVVPGATVKLINERSGSTRDTITNNEG